MPDIILVDSAVTNTQEEIEAALRIVSRQEGSETILLALGLIPDTEAEQRIEQMDTQQRRKRMREAKGTENRRTHCRRGHEMDDDNTYYRSDGTRRCRACHRLTDQRRYEAGKGAKRSSKRSTPTHCAKGHEWTKETTQYRRDGRRICTICTNARYNSQ
jgi:hypothetical protein